LVVAGTAGQVLIMHLNDQTVATTTTQFQVQKINIIGTSPEVESHFVWKGHEPLIASGGGPNQVKQPIGYQLHSLIQLYPPATVSALALNTDWQLVGMGTAHGFTLYDFAQRRNLLIRCTLDPATLLEQAAQGGTGLGHSNNGTISRRKSLKKSLRESFRKLRRGRSQKPQKKTAAELNNASTMRVERLDADMDAVSHRPIERQVESREFKPMDDIPPSVIRYMYFVRTFITSSQQQTNSLWVGTNTGVIYIYALQFMANVQQQQQQQQQISTSLRSNQAVNCVLAKEMRLKHRAPVVHIQVIDQTMQPLPIEQSNLSSHGRSSNAALTEPASHKVIICSEEQFKVFQLPTLKPVCKFKLTAVEGARVRRIGYTGFTSRSDPTYTEHCLSCLSNLGDLSVYNLPQLKR
jgi:lethal(2) giant larvae protein